jgi:ubiquinone/menaquinone biosynthesis C-methylase UbiE
MADQILQGTGTVPTEEERILLESRPHPANIGFRTCQATPLPFADAAFDLTVLNGVILLLRDLPEAAAALAELARVTKSGGAIWLGEALVAEPQRPSKLLKVIKSVGLLASGQRIPLQRPSLVTPVAWIRAEASRLGLRIVLEKTHPALDRDGVNPIENKTRRDFLLSKS